MKVLFLVLSLAQIDVEYDLEFHLNKANQLQYVNIDSAFFHANRALDIADKAQRDQLDKVNNILGRLMVSKSEYDSGVAFHNKALELATQTNDRLEVAESLNNLGIAADEQSHHQSAIAYYFQALKVYEELADLSGQAKVNNNIGIVYKDIGDLAQAVPFYKRAIDIYYGLDNTIGVASMQNNLATLYNDLQHYDSALLMAENSIRYFEENGFAQYKPYPQINAGDAFVGLNRFEDAISMLDEARVGLEETGNQKELADVHCALSKSYFGLNRLDSSLYHARWSYQIAQQVGVAVYEQNALEQLFKTHERLGYADSALFYFRSFVVSKDELREEKRLRQIRSLEIEYETQKTAKELAEATLLVSSQRNQLLLLLNVIVMIVGKGVVIYLRLKSAQKRKITQTKIEEQQQSLIAVINAQEEERTRIARELHDGVGQSMSAILINQKSIEPEKLPGEVQLKLNKATELIESTRKEIRTISHQMMPSSLVEVGLSEALGQMIETVMSNSKIKYEFDSMLTSGKRYAREIEIGIYRVCQELVQNILKHAKASHVSISIYERNQQLQMVIEDDGKGFDINRKSEGIGLFNIHTRLEMINGHCNIESSKGNGTMVTLKIPLT
jgi:signal transduction histidine kinase